MQPGDTFTPQNKPDEDAVEISIPRDTEPATTETPAVASEAAPSSPEPAQEPTPSSTQDQPAIAEASPWRYSTDNEAAGSQLSQPDLQPVSWSASEFVDHEKNSSWFMGLAGITLLAVVIIYLITHDLVTSVVIIMAAALFGVTAHRKPRTLQYQLDHVGVSIGDKSYSYDVFKSFSVLEEGAFNSIQLMPLKRFMPPISLYYPPENEEQIVTMLGSYLPHEDRTHDPIDKLMRKVRF
jgi:hypothetical protein